MFSQEILDRISINTHSSICIRGDRVIYIDPLDIAGAPHDADLVLITHPHFDHYSKRDIAAVMKEGTVLAMPQETAKHAGELLGTAVQGLSPAQTVTLCGIQVETVAAYNLKKPSHPKAKGWLGYVLTLGETRVFITGDTDVTIENQMVQCDILMLPIGGTYTMDALRAAVLANVIHPHTVIPIHYGLGLGGKRAPERFRAAVEGGIETDIRENVYSKVMLRSYLKLVLFALVGFLVGYIAAKLL